METWVYIFNCETKNKLYQVSNYGNVRSITKLSGKIKAISKQNAGKGYISVKLPMSGIMKQVYLHRLVAKNFVPNPHNKNQVNHFDGDKTNNAASNLQWTTCQENIQHSYKYGRSKTGEDRHLTTFTNEQVIAIRKRYDAGMRVCDISRVFGYNKYNVYNVAKRITYKTVD